MPDPRNIPEPTCIKDDINRGERLMTASEIAQLPFLPLCPYTKKPLTQVTINRWMRNGMETIGYRPRLSTRGAVLRFIMAEGMKTPKVERAANIERRERYKKMQEKT